MQPWSDFQIPVRPGLSGEVLTRDWYSVHVRLCESLGKRVEEGVTRYVFSDDPTSDGFGSAIRIRTSDEHVIGNLISVGVPQVSSGSAEKLRNGAIHDLAMTVSSRKHRSRRDPVTPASEREYVMSLLRGNGFAIDDLETFMVGREIYKIRKGRAREFGILCLKVKCRVRIEDAAKATEATLHGVGRDRGMGFGVIVLSEVGS